MTQLVTHWEILPPVQKSFWPLMSPAAGMGFVLYGGTAVALRLGHRQSIVAASRHRIRLEPIELMAQQLSI
ncbi:MAG: hypothetical protein ACP5I8_07815 [Phycisphaerae bacterium]